MAEVVAAPCHRCNLWFEGATEVDVKKELVGHVCLYPTKNRRRLAGEINREEVRGYHFTDEPMFIFTRINGAKCTARVQEFLAAGLASWEKPALGDYAPVVLTEAGQRWRDAAGGAR